MRIALVAHDGSPLSPRASQEPVSQAASIGSHAQALARLGHRVTIYARRDSRGLPGSAILAPGVTVEHVAAGRPAPLAGDELAGTVAAFSDYLARRWHRTPPDVVHAYFWLGGLAALAAVRDLDVPLVQTFGEVRGPRQRDDCADYAQYARIRLEAHLARSADAVLAGTAEDASELARMGAHRACLTVVPLGVDTDTFAPEGPVARKNGRARLLAVVPLDDRHGAGLLVHVLARVPGAELMIASWPGGPDRAQRTQAGVCQELVQLARRLGVESRLAFAGRVPPQRFPALLRSADLLVSAAPTDDMTMIALAAMACGTPVAATAAGSLADAVIDGVTGVLVPPGQPGRLARELRQLLASPLRLEGYGIAAADRARARYSWDRISKETLAVYQRCRQPARLAHATLG
jgi:glycosyltransferase involved in cell wall biosynthesis